MRVAGQQPLQGKTLRPDQLYPPAACVHRHSQRLAAAAQAVAVTGGEQWVQVGLFGTEVVKQQTGELGVRMELGRSVCEWQVQRVWLWRSGKASRECKWA